jgi:hypothetical protein
MLPQPASSAPDPKPRSSRAGRRPLCSVPSAIVQRRGWPRPARLGETGRPTALATRLVHRDAEQLPLWRQPRVRVAGGACPSRLCSSESAFRHTHRVPLITPPCVHVRRTPRSAAAPALAEWRARGGRVNPSVTSAAAERRRQLQRVVRRPHAGESLTIGPRQIQRACSFTIRNC